ncbi:putative BRCT domain-containing protein [Septoria linicola]|nr:putative BRCT domain-containing protein [Septoria linicola]
MADEEMSGPLFEGVVFTIIPSDDLDTEKTNTLLTTLDGDGATFRALRDDDNTIDNIETVTHVISTHVDFEQYSRCLELGIFVVKPSWVRQCIERGRQTSPRQHSPDPSQYFQDVVVCCAAIPEGDADAIKAGVIALGGQPSRGMTKLVTHVITMHMDHPKCKIVEEKGLDCRIVLPHWFDACIKLGKKISEGPYLFPDPEFHRRDNGPVRPSPTPQLKGAISATPTGMPTDPPPSPSKARKNFSALPCKQIYFAEDLQISPHLLETLEEILAVGGAKIINNVDQCDIYIGAYRAGAEYVKASQAGKEVANLAWLYHVIQRNRYTSPMRKLLHYPLPPEGIPGFENMKISLSNYSGEARIYVENLIKYSGAEYTKTMKQDNTHLITAHRSGEKCEAAQEWNIQMVNHLWLEESFAKCAIQAPSNPRFSHFPTRTNLGEVTGQTSLDMKSVERIFFPRPKSPRKVQIQQKPTPQQTAAATSSVLDTRVDQDAMDVDTDIPPAEPQDADTEEETEEEADAEAEPQPVKKRPGRPKKSDVAATPRALPQPREDVDSPMLPSTGRASKLKARESLHSAAADIAAYQKESKRKGGVVYGGRRSSRTDEISSPVPAARNSRKRTSDEYEASALSPDLSDGETQEPGAKAGKKAKTSGTPSLPPIKWRMMVTGDDRWQDKSSKESRDKNALRQLGVSLTQDPSEADILVAPKLLRTKKFVCALAGAPLVVDTTFLDAALDKKKLIDDPPMLKDREGEERLGFRLTDAIERAKQNKRKLFAGWSIYVTKDIKGGFDTYKDIITLNGGSAFLYQGRSGVSLAKRRSQDDPAAGAESNNQGTDDEFGYVYLVSGETPPEIKTWKTFRAEAKKQDLDARIVTSDWVLSAALSQQIVFKDKYLVDQEGVTSQRTG